MAVPPLRDPWHATNYRSYRAHALNLQIDIKMEPNSLTSPENIDTRQLLATYQKINDIVSILRRIEPAAASEEGKEGYLHEFVIVGIRRIVCRRVSSQRQIKFASRTAAPNGRQSSGETVAHCSNIGRIQNYCHRRTNSQSVRQVV